jgi:hypothetical protein
VRTTTFDATLEDAALIMNRQAQGLNSLTPDRTHSYGSYANESMIAFNVALGRISLDAFASSG